LGHREILLPPLPILSNYHALALLNPARSSRAM